jgi:ActR/RegA family two-component response regulator
MVCCLIVASFGIGSWTPASAQEKTGRPELQQQFDAALKFYNDGQYDKAAAELDKILQMNPSSREAMDLRQKTDMGLLIKMLQDPKVGAKIRILLRKSEEEAASLPHDPATIKALIEKATSDDVTVHWSAIRQLTAIGAFAVPQLLDEALSIERMTPESRKLAAFTVLRSMGPEATPPLIVALRYAGNGDADTLATVIAKNPDARAVPPLAAIAGNPDRPENVRKAASDALAAIISDPAAAQLNAADAYFSLAQRYYYSDPRLLELTSDAARGIWRWNPDGKNFAERLVFEPVAPAAYPRLMATEAILTGMQQKHSSPSLIELYICNNYMMLEETAALKDKAPDAQAIKTANESLGAEYLYLALGRALKDSNQPLARRCVEALASVGDPRPPRENTLVSAMTYPDKFVRIEAALALVQLSPMGELGGADETVRVIAAALGAPVRPRVAILTADADLFQRLAKAVHEADLVYEMQKTTGDAVRRAKENASPLSVLVIDMRVEGNKTMAVVNSLHADVRSSRLPIILLAASDEVEKLRADSKGRVAGVMALNADPAQVEVAITNAAGATRGAIAAEDVRENVILVGRILQAVAVLPPATKYPTQDLIIAAAGFLRNQPDNMRILALRAIGNLPRPALRDLVFETFAASSEPAEVRREAGATLLKLLVVNPRISPQQHAQLRALIGDPDELLRTCAIHGMALASIPLGEREAALIEAAATPAAPAPAAPKP